MDIKIEKIPQNVVENRKRLSENLEKQPFKVGQRVLIPRTNGDPSYAKITSYEEKSKKYRVEWINSEGKQCSKTISGEVLKEINDRYTIDGNYFVGKRVLIQRTIGDPTLATIISVPEGNEDKYTVLRKDADKIGRGGERTHIKHLTKADLDKLNVLSEEVEVIG